MADDEIKIGPSGVVAPELPNVFINKFSLLTVDTAVRMVFGNQVLQGAPVGFTHALVITRENFRALCKVGLELLDKTEPTSERPVKAPEPPAPDSINKKPLLN